VAAPYSAGQKQDTEKDLDTVAAACTASEVPTAELAGDTPLSVLEVVQPALGQVRAAASAPLPANPGRREVPCRDPKQQQPQPPKLLTQAQPQPPKLLTQAQPERTQAQPERTQAQP
jgi:hypothetical protein